MSFEALVGLFVGLFAAVAEVSWELRSLGVLVASVSWEGQQRPGQLFYLTILTTCHRQRWRLRRRLKRLGCASRSSSARSGPSNFMLGLIRTAKFQWHRIALVMMVSRMHPLAEPFQAALASPLLLQYEPQNSRYREPEAYLALASCGLERGVRLVWAITTKQFLLGLRTQRSTGASEPGPILLCMGLFSRFSVPALRCTAEEALHRALAATIQARSAASPSCWHARSCRR